MPRPNLSPGKPTSAIRFLLPEALKRAFARLCAQRGVEVSTRLRELIENDVSSEVANDKAG